MLKAVLFLTLVLAAVLTEAQRGDGSNLCTSNKERNQNRCKALPGQYKCSAMYKDLPRRDGKGVRNAWIGGLPDALRKEAVQKSDEIRATFGNLKPNSFWTWDEKNFCDEKTAEARCYVAMQNTASRKLDDCEVNIINEEGDLTLGDLLCQNLVDSGWIKDSSVEIKDMTISMQFSYCGKGAPWKQITDGAGNPLNSSERLCCKPDGKKSRFYRCDGSAYDSSAKCAKK